MSVATLETVAAELRKLGLDAEVKDRKSPFLVVFVESNTSDIPDATVWPPQDPPMTNWAWGHGFEHGTLETDAATVARLIKETLT